MHREVGGLPSFAEANVSDRNAAKYEQHGDTRQGQEPCEDSSAVWSKIDVCQQSEQNLDEYNNDRATLSVDVRGNFGTHT
jgi:hypothetical protein